MHTVPYFQQPDEIAVEVSNKPDPVTTDTGEEYVVEAILKHRKTRDGYQFLTLMKGAPTHDVEWQPTSDFLDPDGTMNEKFYECIKENRILGHLWNNQDTGAVGTTTEEGDD